MIKLKEILLFFSIIVIGFTNASKAMDKSSSESSGEGSSESSSEGKRKEGEYATPTRNVIQFYNTYLRGQGYRTLHGEFVGDLSYNELGPFLQGDIKQEFKRWKTDPSHLSPLSEFERNEQIKAQGADNIIINIAGGVALGLSIEGNAHVFLETDGLIMCNALVITNGVYTLLAHVTQFDTEEVTERCINDFKKHAKANESNIRVFSYYVKKGFQSLEVLKRIETTIKEKFSSIHDLRGEPSNTSKVMINIGTGLQVDNIVGDNFIYHLENKFGESKESINNIRAMTERFQKRYLKKPNNSESWKIVVKDHAQRMGQVLDRLCNIKNKEGLKVKDPWFVSTLTNITF